MQDGKVVGMLLYFNVHTCKVVAISAKMIKEVAERKSLTTQSRSKIIQHSALSVQPTSSGDDASGQGLTHHPEALFDIVGGYIGLQVLHRR